MNLSVWDCDHIQLVDDLLPPKSAYAVLAIPLWWAFQNLMEQLSVKLLVFSATMILTKILREVADGTPISV